PQGDRKKRLRAGYHFNTAEEHRRAKNFTSAVAEYKKAIADAPDEADFYKNLGGTYAQMGKLKEAEDALRKGTQIDPKDWLIWNNLAVTQQMSGKKEDCLKSLKKAMSLHPPDQEAEKMRFTIESLEGKKAPDGKKTGK
ncbi:MAG: tetratricopeptide repeat protein, partial [Candidatus Obscuribacterales bacterium]|nr:tetratricopeptide repeat protein [Candidatus Obscuribacterales bacterium]